jgi:hypothetical protein
VDSGTYKTSVCSLQHISEADGAYDGEARFGVLFSTAQLYSLSTAQWYSLTIYRNYEKTDRLSKLGIWM